MHSVRSDTDSNTLYMTFSRDVTATDLARLDRTAIVAARVLDEGFVLVTDLTECDSITDAAVKRTERAVEQLGQFGLTKEVRVVADATPDGVERRFERTDTPCETVVGTVDGDGDLSPPAARNVTT